MKYTSYSKFLAHPTHNFHFTLYVFQLIASVQVSFCPSVQPSIRPSSQPSVRPSVHPSIGSIPTFIFNKFVFLSFYRSAFLAFSSPFYLRVFLLVSLTANPCIHPPHLVIRRSFV